MSCSDLEYHIKSYDHHHHQSLIPSISGNKTDKIQKNESKRKNILKILINVNTSKSTNVTSWLPMPLDQNWAMANSNVWPPSTGKVKLLREGDEKVTTLSHFTGLFKGQICKTKVSENAPQNIKSFPCYVQHLNSVNEKSSRSVKPRCTHCSLNPSSTKWNHNKSSFNVTYLKNNIT